MRAWLSAAWHFRSVHGRLHVNNPFASSAATCTMSQLRTSSERKLSWSATRQPFTVEIALLFVFSLSNSLFFVSFLHLSDLSHTQEQAGSMPWMQAVAPSPSHNGGAPQAYYDRRRHWNNFQTRPAQAFPKKKSIILLRSEVSWCDQTTAILLTPFCNFGLPFKTSSFMNGN